MKIALVHDDLVQWGGAERVLAALSEIFPEAPIYTLFYDQENKILSEKLAGKKIVTSFLQKIPGWRNLYKALLPLHPIAFEQFDFSVFDVVVSQTTRFAKSIITQPQTKHVCFCHTPPRFLYNFSREQSPPFLKPYFKFLKYYDQISSQRVDTWVAGSINAQNRIEQVYQKSSSLIYPFVDTERFGSCENFNGGYLLVVSRLNRYKRVDLVIQAAEKYKLPLKIVGTGPEEGELKKIASETVEFVGRVDDDILAMILTGCKALVIAGEEDFGLAALEAQACGKPVVAFKKGGVLETVIEGETGYFFDYQTLESLMLALQTLDKKGYNQERCLGQAQKFSKERFMKEFQKLISSL